MIKFEGYTGGHFQNCVKNTSTKMTQDKNTYYTSIRGFLQKDLGCPTRDVLTFTARNLKTSKIGDNNQMQAQKGKT